MAVTLKRLSGPTQLTAALVTQYTSPGVAGTNKTRLGEILLANTDPTNDRTVTIHFVIAAGAAGATNKIFPLLNIPANQTIKIKLDTVLEAGDFVSALASAAAFVNMMISGAEIA